MDRRIKCSLDNSDAQQLGFARLTEYLYAPTFLKSHTRFTPKGDFKKQAAAVVDKGIKQVERDGKFTREQQINHVLFHQAKAFMNLNVSQLQTKLPSTQGPTAQYVYCQRCLVSGGKGACWQDVNIIPIGSVQVVDNKELLKGPSPTVLAGMRWTELYPHNHECTTHPS